MINKASIHKEINMEVEIVEDPISSKTIIQEEEEAEEITLMMVDNIKETMIRNKKPNKEAKETILTTDTKFNNKEEVNNSNNNNINLNLLSLSKRIIINKMLNLDKISYKIKYLMNKMIFIHTNKENPNNNNNQDHNLKELLRTKEIQDTLNKIKILTNIILKNKLHKHPMFIIENKINLKKFSQIKDKMY